MLQGMVMPKNESGLQQAMPVEHCRPLHSSREGAARRLRSGYTMNRTRICIGALLSLAAGIELGHAWMGGARVEWGLGALVLLAGSLLIAFGFHSRKPSVEPRPPLAPGPSEPAEPPAPMLGELLVKRGLISPWNLTRALLAQQESGQRLGEVLIEMRLVSRADLVEVMEEQRVYRQRGFVWRG